MLEPKDLQMISEIVINAIEPVKEDVSGLKEDVSGLKEDVSVLKEDVSVLKEDVSGLKEDVSVLKEDVSVLKEDVSGLKEDVSGLKGRMTALEEKTESEFGQVKASINAMQLMMENEINKEIQIIAEGHLDLNRKLDEALNFEKEKEMLKIRMTRLENKIDSMNANGAIA